jgi:hypothetical protein
MIWKDVKGFEGIYQVSSTGILKCLERRIKRPKKGEYISKSILRKGNIGKRGYVQIPLSKNGKRYSKTMHQIVAVSFLENPNNYKEVNHINGIKHDNRVENLEWCSRSENIIHAVKTGLLPVTKGSERIQSKITEEQAIEIKYSDKSIKGITFAKKYNVTNANISNIRKGVTWKHI